MRDGIMAGMLSIDETVTLWEIESGLREQGRTPELAALQSLGLSPRDYFEALLTMNEAATV